MRAKRSMVEGAPSSLRAVAKQSSRVPRILDCFLASLLSLRTMVCPLRPSRYCDAVFHGKAFQVQSSMERVDAMLETLRENAIVVQALAAIVGVLLIIFLLYISRLQARVGRLIVLREIVREHHSRKMRALRRIVRNDLTTWI